MPRGRPGGNPNIKEHGFKTDREHPLTELVAFRVDKPTKEKIQSGKLSNWQKIAREALEKAIADLEEAEAKQAEEELKSA